MPSSIDQLSGRNDPHDGIEVEGKPVLQCAVGHAIMLEQDLARKTVGQIVVSDSRDLFGEL